MANEKSAPGAIVGLLGPSPLLNGENAEHYNQLLSRVTEELEAKDDVILQLLIKQFVDGYWESARYGRHRGVMIDRRVQQGLEFQAERRKKQKEQRDAALQRIATKLGQPQNEFVGNDRAGASHPINRRRRRRDLGPHAIGDRI